MGKAWGAGRGVGYSRRLARGHEGQGEQEEGRAERF